MPRPSPASTRVTQVFDLLARHPNESFRLSEIARRLSFNKATTHGMLTTLAETEYLAYDADDKTFSLGPNIVQLATAAVASDEQLAQFAMPEMAALAQAVGGQVVVNTVVGDEFVVLASAGEPADGARGSRVGYRGRMAPPVGMIYYAWASPGRVEQWLDRIWADEKQRARYKTLLAVVAERGFSISADQELRAQLDRLIDQLHDASEDEAREVLRRLIADIARGEHELVDIVPDQLYRTRQLSAPIWDAPGTVRMGMLMTGLPELTGTELLERAGVLMSAADRVSELIAGRDPYGSSASDRVD